MAFTENEAIAKVHASSRPYVKAHWKGAGPRYKYVHFRVVDGLVPTEVKAAWADLLHIMEPNDLSLQVRRRRIERIALKLVQIIKDWRAS